MKKGLFDLKIKYDDITVFDSKKLSLDDVAKMMEALRRKFG